MLAIEHNCSRQKQRPRTSGSPPHLTVPGQLPAKRPCGRARRRPTGRTPWASSFTATFESSSLLSAPATRLRRTSSLIDRKFATANSTSIRQPSGVDRLGNDQGAPRCHSRHERDATAHSHHVQRQESGHFSIGPHPALSQSVVGAVHQRDENALPHDIGSACVMGRRSRGEVGGDTRATVRQRRQKAGMRSTSTLYTSSRPVSMAKLSHHFTASG